MVAVAVPILPTLGGCKPAAPKTPLAHLYGEQWIHGAYELYAKKYDSIHTAAEYHSFETYRILAQKGMSALAALQTREVPFFVRASDGEQFHLERSVPERLTFTAGMSASQREETTRGWNLAREHLHTDYDEIRRINQALTTLLGQIRSVRNAIESARIEQYQIVRKLDVLDEGGPPPFALPYQVSSSDYHGVLLLLLERLEEDMARLQAIESSIVSVGFLARSTDANSGSLADNLGRVLLAVMEDSRDREPGTLEYPRAEDEKKSLSKKGDSLRDRIRSSLEYKAWIKAEKEKEFEQIGGFLTLLDRMTGLPASTVFKQVLDIWSGDADYLSYLKMLSSFLPGGSHVAKVIEQGIDLTSKVRGVVDTLAKGEGPDAILALAKKEGLGVLNTQSKYAVDRVTRQLSFLKTPSELQEMRATLEKSSLLEGTLPALSP